MKTLLYFLFTMAAVAQPARMKVLSWPYPSNELAGVYFTVESTTNLKDWATIAIIDLASITNGMTFYRVGVDWRTNAPSWVTNFQMVELPPPPTKAKALTAGSKAGKLSTPVPLPPKTYRAVPMPPLSP